MSSDNKLLIRAIDLQNQGELEQATELFNQVLISEPANAAALYSLSLIHLKAGRLNEAKQYSGTGVRLAANYAPLWLIHGAVLQALEDKQGALDSYDKALQIKPDYLEVLTNSGVLLRNMMRHKESLERFQRVLAIDPNHQSALANSGILLTEFKQSEQAIAMFARLLKINPDYDYGLGLLAYERLHICDWTDFAETSQKIVEGIRAGKRTCKTLALMAISDSASDHFQAAKLFSSNYCPPSSRQIWQGERYKHDKIRLAYISPDLREHPVGHLMAGIFEHHDKSRFETIGISLGIDDQSRLRARMLKAFDRFIDARNMGSVQIAQMMRDMEVDIAVDLGGYTSDTRTEIFSFRPAPVQVNYLGYPGTMGTNYFDYILADRHIIPVDQQQFYSEKVAYMPDTYLPTDSSVQISERTPTRAECGLPETGVVFCSFSHDYKISPHVFDVWMRLLTQVPGSVLWLMSRGEASQRNLRKEANARGVDPARLVFASRVPLVEDHLARYRQADIFLDTHPYNAHTTAADALMAGLPVVTYTGNSFPSRVAGSLLHAMGVPELVTHSLAEYESLALRLALSPGELQATKQRIRDNKASCSLFNTAGFCRNMEAIFIEMWRKAESGEPQVEMKSGSNNLAARPQPALPVSQPDNNLLLAQELFRQGNLPQAEIYARHSFAGSAANPGAASLLDDLRRGYGIADSFELSERASPQAGGDRYLLVKAWGYGFWSDVHHVLTQLLLAELTRRTPIILWGRNSLFRKDADVNAFGHFFQEISPARLEDIPRTATIYPAKWSWENIYEENINKWEGEGSRLAAPYLFDRTETLLVSDFYATLSSIIPWIGRSSKYYGWTEDALYGELFQKYLKPTAGIAAKVDDFHTRHMRGHPWVGVHIRGSDKINESPHLARTNAGYFGFIDRIVELNPTIGIFLLTDSATVMGEFEKRYGQRLLSTQATRDASNVGVHYSGHDGTLIGEEVLIDALLATRCEYFVGNKESNVSLAIASMRNWPSGFIFLLGEKNIRGENLFLHKR